MKCPDETLSAEDIEPNSGGHRISEIREGGLVEAAGFGIHQGHMVCSNMMGFNIVYSDFTWRKNAQEIDRNCTTKVIYKIHDQ